MADREGNKFRRCFVSAPFGVDVSAVLSVLSEKGVHARRLDSLSAGKSISGVIRRELQRSDFVCVILPQEFNISSTLFELGMAAGLGKPTIILAEQDVSIPVDVADWPFGRVSLEKPETIRIAINSLLQNLQQKARASEDKASHGPIALKSDDIASVRIEKVREPPFDREKALGKLEAIKRIPSGNRGQEFEKFVGSLFEEAGIPVASEIGQSDRGIDLAFWLDDVSRVIANPILVEVKTKIDGNSWKENSAQLIHYLNVMRAQCGIVITLESRPPNVPRFTRTLPLVVNLSGDELVSLLSKRQLGKELIRVRNQAVHG